MTIEQTVIICDTIEAITSSICVAGAVSAIAYSLFFNAHN